MRSATALLITTGTLFLSSCSLLIDAKLDGAGTTSGNGGQGGTETTSSSASTGAGATSTTSAGQSVSASVGASSGGGCVPACMLANAASACVGGVCAVTTCDSHFGDCNALPGDGCEINLNNDDSNCGGCNKPCKSGKSCKGSSCK
jgi:hypothetical protein